MIYISAPYSETDLQKTYAGVQRYFTSLCNKGIVSLSPILMGHPVVHLVKDIQFWYSFSSQLVQLCSEVRVLQIPGWDTSEGVALEIKIAKQYNIPVVYVSDAGHLFQI